MQKIYYSKPSITDLEIKYVEDAIRNGWGERCYDYIKKFELLFRQYIGTEYALATSSCTGALHMALTALDISPGDEVIVPDLTWIASVAPITYLGAKPVFVDVLPDTWCINPKAIEQAVTARTKAIIPVHLYGNVCEMDEIMSIARRNNLAVIEDAAEAIGSEYKGRKCGNIGDMAVFSFHGTKVVTTGEGGMLVANSKELYEKVSVLADHGRDPKVPRQFWCEAVGYKYKMSNLQAAVGVAQMERVEQLVNRKIEIFRAYSSILCRYKELALNPEAEHVKNSYWMPTVIFNGDLHFKRDDLLKIFQQHNIDSRVFFYPVSSFKMFMSAVPTPESYRLSGRGINLPSYFDITLDEIKRVCQVIIDYLETIK